MSSKKDLSERDICTQFILPALERAGWDKATQIRQEVYLTDGKIIVRGSLHSIGKRRTADIVLYYKPNIPIAIIEIKKNKYSVRAGLQQAMEYRELLIDVPVVFSTNGDAFFEHDYLKCDENCENEINIDNFPAPENLWQRYKRLKGITEKSEEVAAQDYYYGDKRELRYYQQIAINRIVQAIANGENRILLVLATGTGKTYIAFQAIYRLWKSRFKKRILFLADRNALVSQTRTGDFRHFREAMTVIRKKKIEKSYQVYLALYQGLTDYDEDTDAYRQFSPDFFDLVIIDECHRGSAAADSAWREILNYFSSATHIGLTATPKESKTVSNIDYFGEPIYTYSLKQGIEDGFLAPYKVIRVGINVDLEGWRPNEGKKDIIGNEIEDRDYNLKDYDRNLVIEERTQLVAKKITEYLAKTDRYAKTIVFCVDIEHAERMTTALRNLNSDICAKNPKYVVQITGDNEDGRREIDNFINPESRYPVIATTSKLLSTGIDAQTCKLIVLDANIGSMTEFKQIIGRGTRINKDFGKYWFTILDFRNNSKKFADKNFDGPPIQNKDYDPDDEFDPDDETIECEFEIGEGEGEIIVSPPFPEGGRIDEPEPTRKIYVNNVEIWVLNERVQYYGNNGKLITETLLEFTKNNIKETYKTLNNFINKWNSADKKKAIVDELFEQGILLTELEKEIGEGLDPFDLICHVAFDKPPLTRRERAEKVKKRNYFAKYEDKARQILISLLDKYADAGIENIENMEVLTLNPFNQIGSPIEIIKVFGSKAEYLKALKELEIEIYKVA